MFLVGFQDISHCLGWDTMVKLEPGEYPSMEEVEQGALIIEDILEEGFMGLGAQILGDLSRLELSSEDLLDKGDFSEHLL